MHPAIFLDRDGTLIDFVRDEETGAFTTAFHPSHLRLLPGVIEGLTLFRDAGFLLFLVTNQPGPAKGHFSPSAVERTHRALAEMLAAHGLHFTAVRACMHHPTGGPGGESSLITKCPCRKPKPGMLLTLIHTFQVDPTRSWMVGDTPSDIEAGRAAGVKTALLFSPTRCELCPLRKGPSSSPDLRGTTLLNLAQRIITQ